MWQSLTPYIRIDGRIDGADIDINRLTLKDILYYVLVDTQSLTQYHGI